MAEEFKSIAQRVVEASPPWLSSGNAQKFLGVVAGLNRDAALEADVFAGTCGFFASDKAPDDACGFIGDERILRKFPQETFTEYRVRLQQAWRAWSYAGSGTTIKEQLGLLGIAADLKQANDPAWNWGTLPSWRHFWVVVTVHPFGAVPRWGTFSWGDGTSWGGDQATRDGILAIRSIVAQFKPAHMRCENIIVVNDLTAWNANQPDGTWDNPSNRPGGNVAVFWPGF